MTLKLNRAISLEPIISPRSVVFAFELRDMAFDADQRHLTTQALDGF